MGRHIHACALVVGGQGLLIRGASGTGKSSLTLALLALARAQGVDAALVGDDRIGLRTEAGRLYASPHQAIAGQIEERGRGIRTLPYQAEAQIQWVVVLGEPHAECDIPPQASVLPDSPATFGAMVLHAYERSGLDPGLDLTVRLAHLILPAGASSATRARLVMARVLRA